MSRTTRTLFGTMSLCLAAVVLLVLPGSAGAGGLFVGFEQSEGCPDFLGNVNGLTVNGVTWTVLGGLAADNSGDGPGLRTEDASNPSISGTAPAVDGVAQLLADGRDGGGGQIARVEIDLDNSLNLAFDSLYYANRGGFLPRLKLEYYDLNEQLLGTNLYARGAIAIRRLRRWAGRKQYSTVPADRARPACSGSRAVKDNREQLAERAPRWAQYIHQPRQFSSGLHSVRRGDHDV